MKSHSFYYIETKKVCNCYLQGLTQQDLEKKILQDNLFQVQSTSRRKSIAGTIYERVGFMDSFLISSVVKRDADTSKLIVLYAILKTDRLFYDFVNEVFREKMAYSGTVITDREIESFFETKCEQHERIAKWKPHTLYKLKQVYVRILFEAGLLENKKGAKRIVRPFFALDVQEHLEEIGEQHYMRAILGDSII